MAFLLDSLRGHCRRSVHEEKYKRKNFVAKTVAKGTATRIQSLNVYRFQPRKNYVRRLSNDVLLYDNDINLHSRNNII